MSQSSGIRTSGTHAETHPASLCWRFLSDIPWMVDLYEQGRLKLDELISNRFTLDQINEAIADTRSGSAKRNVIMLK